VSKGQITPFQTGSTVPFLPDLKPVPLLCTNLNKGLNKCRSVKGERLKSTKISGIKICCKTAKLLGIVSKIRGFGSKVTWANSPLPQEG